MMLLCRIKKVATRKIFAKNAREVLTFLSNKEYQEEKKEIILFFVCLFVRLSPIITSPYKDDRFPFGVFSTFFLLCKDL